MNPGEDALLFDKGKNNWRWAAWIEKFGKDGNPFGSWCKNLGEAGACTLCSRKLVYATSRKKVLPQHELDLAHSAAVHALTHTTRLPGATTTADVLASITDHVCDLKIRACTCSACIVASFGSLPTTTQRSPMREVDYHSD